MFDRLVYLNRVIALHILFISICFSIPSPGFSTDSYPVPKLAEAKVTWIHNDPIPEGYRIYCRTKGQSYDFTKPCWSGLTNTGTVYNLEWGNTHYFVVKAYAGGMYSENSAEVSLTTPPVAPTTPSISYDAPIDLTDNTTDDVNQSVSDDAPSDPTDSRTDDLNQSAPLKAVKRLHVGR
jgi:hypothetical protein